MVQEVLTLLVQKLPGFVYNPNQRFRGWLWTLTLNQWRAGKRRRALPIASGDGQLADVAAPEGIDGIGECEYRHYVVGRVLRLIQREFQENTWRAFWKSVAEDQAAEEVAHQLRISVAAVYAAKSRVLRRLRQETHLLLD